MRNNLRPYTLTDQLADCVERDIRLNTWDNYVPGKRVLAARYAVNVKTCAAALLLLEHRGVLAVAMPGKSRAILMEDRAQEAPSNVAVLLVLCSAQSVLSDNDRRIVDMLGAEWSKSGGEVVSVTLDYSLNQKPEKVLRKYKKQYAARALVMFCPPKEWAETAACMMPCFRVGGEYSIKESGLSLCAYAITPELQRLIHSLQKLGHERIFIPTVGVNTMLRNAIQEAFSLTEYSPEYGDREDYSPQFKEDVPEVWQAYWQKYLRTLKPSVVVIFEDAHLLSLYSYCADSGVKIPQDLSVISFAHNELFTWLSPRPTMMRFPLHQLRLKFRKWLSSDLASIGRNIVELEVVDGGSLRAIRE